MQRYQAFVTFWHQGQEQGVWAQLCQTLDAAVENAENAATAVMDHSGVLQVSGGYRNALAASTQHMSDQFLGHQQIRAVFPVVTQRQPATEPLFNRMQAIAHSRLGNLREEGLCIPKKQVLKRSGMRECLLQPLRW